MPPDNARNLLTILNGIDDFTIGHIQVFAKLGTHQGRGFLRLMVAFFTRTSGSHFTSREIHNTEGSPFGREQQCATTSTPFDIVRMRTKQQNVY
jgi:hypothetical protein